MNRIIGFTDLALKSELSGELREYLDTVRTSAEWLMHIISEILDFSRMGTGHLELERTEFSLADCLSSAMKFVQPEAATKNLRTAFKIDPEIPLRLCGDPTRLRQIVVNLLENAVKFTTSGGVMLSATLESTVQNVITVRILVADTGVGISSERQQFIFEPFRLADGSLNTNFGGTGLGLAVSSRLVTLMGGTMDVRSQIGAGATFRFNAQFEKAHGPSAKGEPPRRNVLPLAQSQSGNTLPDLEDLLRSKRRAQPPLSGDLVGLVSAAQSSGGTSPMLVSPSRPSVGSTTSIP